MASLGAVLQLAGCLLLSLAVGSRSLEAADLVGGIRNNAGDDALVVAASPSTRVGKVDDTLDELHQDPGVVAEVLRLDVTLP